MPDRDGRPTREEIIAFRKRHALKQADLAALAGVHRRTVEEWERREGAPFRPPARLVPWMAEMDAKALVDA